MSVSSIKTGDTGISLLVGNTKVDYSSTWLIERQTLTNNSTIAVTFSNIPQDYKALQIRANIYPAPALGLSGNADVQIRYNGDTGTNYAHNIARGSDIYSASNIRGTASRAYFVSALGGDGTESTTLMSTIIADIQDYSSTTKTKTCRHYCGFQRNSGSASVVSFGSNHWNSTAAITSIEFRPAAAYELGSGSTIALYGIK